MSRPPIKFILLIVTAALFYLSSLSYAQPPRTVSYQGYLTDSGGNPLDTTASGPIQMIFTIYDDPAAGASQWTETQLVTVNQGVYGVVFGSNIANPLNAAFDVPYYLEVQVETAAGSNTFETLSPRQPLTGVPYAVNADTVDGQHAAEFAALSHSHAGADISSGMVQEAYIDPSIARDSELTWGNLSGIPAGFADGVDNDTVYSAGTGLNLIGTSFRLNVPLSLSGSSTTGIIEINNTDSGGRGIGGQSSGQFGQGVFGAASGTDGKGVYGWATSGTGTNYGGYFKADGSSGRGVYGYAPNGGIGGYFYSPSGYGLIVEDGNVGVGTTAPQERMDIIGNIKVTPGNYVYSYSGYSSGRLYPRCTCDISNTTSVSECPFTFYSLNDQGATCYDQRYIGSSYESRSYTRSNTPSPVLVSDYTGRVGIGTDAPIYTLTVNGSVGADSIRSSSTGYYFPDGSLQTTAVYVRTETATSVINANTSSYFSVSCLTGYKVMGGGWNHRDTSGGRSKDVYAYVNYPSSDNTWQVGIRNNSATWYYVDVYATCIHN